MLTKKGHIFHRDDHFRKHIRSLTIYSSNKQFKSIFFFSIVYNKIRISIPGQIKTTKKARAWRAIFNPIGSLSLQDDKERQGARTPLNN